MPLNFKAFLLGPGIELVQEKCQPFLRQSEGHPLYRGLHNPFKPFARVKIATVRKDRRPRDSSPFIHDLLDDWFEKHFGVRARSEGVFCTGHAEHAAQYGDVYYVFPIGEFKFIWSSYPGRRQVAVRDTGIIANAIQHRCRTRTEKEAPGIVEEEMSKYDWLDNDLPAAIQSEAEITLLCAEVILVPKKEHLPYAKIIGGET